MLRLVKPSATGPCHANDHLTRRGEAPGHPHVETVGWLIERAAVKSAVGAPDLIRSRAEPGAQVDLHRLLLPSLESARCALMQIKASNETPLETRFDTQPDMDQQTTERLRKPLGVRN